MIDYERDTNRSADTTREDLGAESLPRLASEAVAALRRLEEQKIERLKKQQGEHFKMADIERMVESGRTTTKHRK
jgi:hypothetical protein